MALRGFRWSVILDRAGIETARIEPYALEVVGYMGNTVLPLRGGEAIRVMLLRERSDATWANAIGSVVPERVLDVITLGLLFAVVVLSGTIATPGGDGPALLALAVVLGLVGFGLAFRWLRRRGRLGRLADRIRPLAAASRPLFTSVGVSLGALSVTIWLLDGTVFWLIARSLDLPVGLLDGVAMAIVATGFSLIPAGPAYAGTYDAALLVSLGALDVTGGAAVSYILLVRFLVFVPVTLVGLVLVVARYGGLTRLRRRESHGPPNGEGDLGLRHPPVG